ncbi:MAG: glycosyltransferase family protein [Magnetococcales bacterium]|nr:glycosyltransferase family protein [Magnetococcales bacterium]
MNIGSSLLTVDPLQGAIHYHRQGQFDRAIELYEMFMKQFPGHSQALYLCGLAHQERGEMSRAVERISQAILLEPAQADYHVSLGTLLRQHGHSRLAAECFTAALQLAPDDKETQFNLADTWMDLGQIASAMEHFAMVLRLDPQCVPAYINLGLCLKSVGRFDEAIVCFRQACMLQPDSVEAHINHAMVLLLVGRYQEGWREYAWRFRLESIQSAQPQLPPSLQPWNGESLVGKTLLVLAEQGYGDNIQFVRYLPLLQQRGARVMLQCHAPLLPLFESITGIDRLIPYGDSDALGRAAMESDGYCHLLSIPSLVGTTVTTVPDVPRQLLSLPQSVISHWQRYVCGDGIKVGLVWHGKPLHRNDPARYRSCSLSQLMPLAEISSATFYSLQARQDSGARAEIPAAAFVIDLGDDLVDFQQTAAAMMQLDLIITVDSAAAHLAATLGKPTWLLLPCAPDWRWGAHDNETPWYPTMHLFRQRVPGDWGHPVQAIKNRLAMLIQRCR